MAKVASKSKFAAKEVTLLAALGLPSRRRERKRLRGWMQLDGFPKRERSGWSIESVKSWVAANAERIAAADALLEVMSGTASPSDLKLIKIAERAAEVSGSGEARPHPGPLPQGEGGRASTAGDTVDQLGNADTLTALAAMLARHYSNTISIQINPQTINDWRHGKRLPARECPLPPAKDGKYWNARQWADWFSEHCLHHYRVTPSGQGELLSPRRLADMELEDQIAELEQNKRRREIENGLYFAKSEVAAAADAIGQRLKGELVLQYERLFERKLSEVVRGLGLGAELESRVMAAVRGAGRSGTDQILAALSEQLQANAECGTPVISNQ